MATSFTAADMLKTTRSTDKYIFICSHSFTNPGNLAKIGPVDVEIVVLIGIVKNKKQERNI